MQLHHSVTGEGQVVLQVTGELDAAQSTRFAHALETLVRAGARRVVLDLTTADFLDCAVVGSLVPRVRGLRLHGGDLVVACDRPAITRVLTSTGTDEVLAIVPTVAAAQDCIELHPARARRRGHAHQRRVATTRGRLTTKAS